MSNVAVSRGRSSAKAIAKMNSKQKSILQQVEALLQRAEQQMLTSCYDLGTLVIKAKETAAEDESSDSPVFLLAEAVGGQWTPPVLMSFARVVEAFPRPVFDKLSKRRTAKGTALSFTHFQFLARVPDEDKQRKVIEDCFAKSMTVSELKIRVQQATGGKRSKGGRRPNMPKSPLAGLSQMAAVLTSTVSKCTNWDTAVVEQLKVLPDEGWNEDLISGLEKAYAVTRDVSLRLNSEAEELSDLLDRGRTAISTVKDAEDADGDDETPAKADKSVAKADKSVTKADKSVTKADKSVAKPALKKKKLRHSRSLPEAVG